MPLELQLKTLKLIEKIVTKLMNFWDNLSNENAKRGYLTKRYQFEGISLSASAILNELDYLIEETENAIAEGQE